ncbi:hypothetical protein Rsub_00324 [Raphidocelis subcapitata]|uniref:Peptidase C-terminal archaeal/bacterial domain-containing protein n=1 Tax=Raphidocelis subcapitata TaxID=307507 RepID=A0A2V0NQ16_9CHLO|nr:hypothetical protein Rsub_00324 [Raphidocelis subcapitata]|eukprot:GBF87613.1 hypothetical protein Rsub_00324 [Raphidocelis subcapitata]
MAITMTAACLAVALLLAAPHSAAGRPLHERATLQGGKPHFDHIAWDGDAPAAIAAAGSDVVARRAGVDVAELAHILQDRDIGFDKKTKKLIYACEGLAVPEGAPLPPPAALPGADDPADLTMAFKLHSRPGANRVLLLDFTGYTATGTAWNSMTNGTPIVSPAYDIDGDATTFSDQERANIIAIWRAVSEDYAPWNVDVTTEETDAAGSPIVLTSRGVRAVIGGSSLDWYGAKTGAKTGGVAYVNTFGSAYYEPAYVFPAQLSNGAPKYVAEATSHELGHRLGLSHDGDATNGYYAGHANWAPIMGNSYGKPVSQWSKGEYAGANQLQDDLAVISIKLTRRADANGNTATTATPLSAAPVATNPDRLTNTTFGNIETTGDVDFFSFTAGGNGPAVITVALTPGDRADADMRLDVFGADGATLLATFDTAGALLSGPFTVDLPAAGTYFAALTGVGDGADGVTGYTNYASLGEYRLTVEWPAVPTTAVQPQPSPSPSPRTLAVVVASSQKVFNKKTGTSYKVTVAARDASGANILAAATFSVTWSSTSGAFAARSVTTRTSATTGTIVLSSPVALTPATQLTLTSASLAGYTWDRAASFATVSYTF